MKEKFNREIKAKNRIFYINYIVSFETFIKSIMLFTPIKRDSRERTPLETQVPVNELMMLAKRRNEVRSTQADERSETPAVCHLSPPTVNQR